MQSPPIPNVELLSPAQVAALLYVHTRTVARWAEAGRLVPHLSPTGQRGYERDDVLRFMVERNRESTVSSTVPAEFTARAYQSAVAEGALSVTLTAAAVEAAEVLASDAAATARRGRAAAGHEAEVLVANEAAQNVVAAKFRADSAAFRVAEAAELAAASERELTPLNDAASLIRAARTAETVQAAALQVAEETNALAMSVASAVAMTAELVATTRLTLEHAIEAQVVATAAALELRTLAAAHLAARELDSRLGRPSRAAAEPGK
jgi:hypothetical protein